MPRRRRAHATAVLCTASMCAIGTPLRAQAALQVSATTVTLPTPTPAEYDAQYTQFARVDYVLTGCDVSPGHTCTLGLWSTTGAFGAKTIDQVEWQLNGTSSWYPVTTLQNDRNLTTITTPNASGSILIRVRLSWGADVASRSYVASLRLMLTQH